MVIPKFGYKLFISEAGRTALLLFGGLNIVIFNWGEGSVVAKHNPSELTRTILTGFMFGCVGCLVSLSPVGKIINCFAASLPFALINPVYIHKM